MNTYVILDITDTENLSVVCEGDTRKEAFSALTEVAELGKVYHEAKLLGAPIEPRERKAVTLTRAKVEDDPDNAKDTGGNEEDVDEDDADEEDED